MAKVVVSVLNLNRLSMLQRCVESLLLDAGIPFRFMVWDGGSDDGSVEWLLGSGLDVQYDDPPDPGCWPRYSYAQTVNRSAKYLFERYPESEFFFTLNNDSIAIINWLAPLVETLSRDPRVGHVGPTVLYGQSTEPHMRGKVQSAGAFFMKQGLEWITRSAYCMGNPPPHPFLADYTGFGLYRRDLFEKFGGLDEGFAPIYYDDASWGYTLWDNGYEVVVDSRAAIVHDHLSMAQMYLEKERSHHFSSNAGSGENKQRFILKWAHLLQPDGTRSPILPPIVGC